MYNVFLIAPSEQSLKESVIAFDKTESGSLVQISNNRVNLLYMRRIQENVGIESIAAYLSKNNVSARCVNMSIGQSSEEKLINEILADNPTVVGISLLYDLHVYNAVRLVVLLRKSGYKGHITLGGTFISLAYERFLKSFPLIDSIVIGDGEQVFYNLYMALTEGKGFDGIEGLAYMTEDGIIQYIPQCYTGKQAISAASRETLDYLYSAGIPVSTALIVAGRGCNNNCVYCSAPAMRKQHGKVWVQRPVSELADEIEQLKKKYNIQYLYFCDDNFCGYGEAGKKHLADFADEMHRRGLRINFHAEIRADSKLTKDELLALKSVGLDEALIGIESGAQSCLNRWRKGVKVSDNQKMLDLLKECSIKAAPAFILVDPYTTVQELKECVDFIEKNKLHMMNDPWYLFNQMIAYPGTDLEKILIHNKTITVFDVPVHCLEDLKSDDDVRKFCFDISVVEYDITSKEVRIIWECLRKEADDIIHCVNLEIPSFFDRIRQDRELSLSCVSNVRKWRKNIGELLLHFLQYAVEWGENPLEGKASLSDRLKELRTNYDLKYFDMILSEYFRHNLTEMRKSQ